MCNVSIKIWNIVFYIKYPEQLGTYFKTQKEWSLELRVKVLKTILETIVVSYNNEDLTHELHTRLKIPLDTVATNTGRKTPLVCTIKPSETPLKTRKSTRKLVHYSTVTDTLGSGGSFMVISVLFKSSNLWMSPYSQYQHELFNIIKTRHEDQGHTFVEICDYLVGNGYKSPRGKDLKPNHVWSIYDKKKKSLQRFGRVFDPVIQEVKLDLIDYFPQE